MNNLGIIQERLLTYQCKTILDQESALKEIMQEIALMALARAGFFRIAAFQGGTCLRILYKLPRFSEDLDFILEKSDKHFEWSNYIQCMLDEFNTYGLAVEFQDKKKSDKAIQSIFLKTNSVGGLLIIKSEQKTQFKIKLEIDTHPPYGSSYEMKYLDFPLPYSIKTQDLPSLFASKSHVLLCRQYVKGRDWFDFIWYISREIQINFSLLTHAINQAGPWKGKNIIITPIWFVQILKSKIQSIDWFMAKKDVMRFLRERELESLEIWSEAFFLSRVEKLAGYLNQIKNPQNAGF